MKSLRHLGVLAAVGLALIGGGSALAQDATAVPVTSLTANFFDGPYTPSPDLCLAKPLSSEQIASTLATPTPLNTPAVTSAGIAVLPSGSPADPVVADAVLNTLTQLWACNNANMTASTLALFTTDGMQRVFGVTESSGSTVLDIQANVDQMLADAGTPRPENDRASIDAVFGLVQHEDGSVGVLVLNSDASVAGGDQVLDYFEFVPQNGLYLVSNIILDPFDLTPGYGFEKA